MSHPSEEQQADLSTNPAVRKAGPGTVLREQGVMCQEKEMW